MAVAYAVGSSKAGKTFKPRTIHDVHGRVLNICLLQAHNTK